jgi:hypothetical protein
MNVSQVTLSTPVGQFWGLSGSYQSTQTISNTLFGGFYQLYSDGVNWIFLALAAYGFNGELSSPVALRAPSLRINNSDITTIFAPRASPTFTGTTTAATLNATSVSTTRSIGQRQRHDGRSRRRLWTSCGVIRRSRDDICEATPRASLEP